MMSLNSSRSSREEEQQEQLLKIISREEGVKQKRRMSPGILVGWVANELTNKTETHRSDGE